jgi:DNA-directed RNA polymerase subunit RPC12/RpoP
MSARYSAGRPALALVPDTIRAPSPSVWFCSHCGSPQGTEDEQPESRVCTDCGLGVLLQTRSDVAPSNGGAFIVLDRSLSVCAVSASAERLLATLETDAINRHVTELLVPADSEAGAANLASAVTWAASGDEASHTVTVRPANTFGIRLTARIAGCSPPRAALLVFD